jgi:hypothetical protein
MRTSSATTSDLVSSSAAIRRALPPVSISHSARARRAAHHQLAAPDMSGNARGHLTEQPACSHFGSASGRAPEKRTDLEPAVPGAAESKSLAMQSTGKAAR